MATTSRAKAKRNARAAQRVEQSDPDRANNRVLARNRRATWQYEITQRIEAGNRAARQRDQVAEDGPRLDR